MQEQKVASANHLPRNLILSLVTFSNHVSVCPLNILKSNNFSMLEKYLLGKITIITGEIWVTFLQLDPGGNTNFLFDSK